MIPDYATLSIVFPIKSSFKNELCPANATRYGGYISLASQNSLCPGCITRQPRLGYGIVTGFLVPRAA